MRALDGVMEVVAAALVAATAVITCLAVFFRSVIGASLPWPEEVSGYLLVWISFAGAYLALRDRGHIAFDLVLDVLPATVRRIVQTAIDVLVAGFLILLSWLAWRMVAVVGSTGLETVDIPVGVFMAALPVGSVAMTLALAARIVRRWRGDEAEEP